MVTMSQKSFVPQAAKSVSQALMSDIAEDHDRKQIRVERRKDDRNTTIWCISRNSIGQLMPG